MNKRESPSFELKIFGSLRYGDRLKQGLLAFVVIVAVGAFGSTLLHGSKAATPTASVEAESGIVAAPATATNDATASGTHAVKFGTSGGSGSCVNSTNYPAGFPNNCTTGVPAGTTLTAYTGPQTITSCGVVISNAIITGNINVTASNGTHSASTPCVTIKDSLINGIVATGTNTGTDGPLVMTDDEVAAPNNSGNEALNNANYYLDGVNIHGGDNGGAECYGYCTITNSWIHDFYDAGSTHYDAIISNGNIANGPMVFTHNSLACNFGGGTAPGGNGGCSADMGLFGDFAQISNTTVDSNLFAADILPADINNANGNNTPAYCAYGGTVGGKAFPVALNVSFTNNVFQIGNTVKKCGQFGAIADFNGGTNVTWTNNKYDDGTTVAPQ